MTSIKLSFLITVLPKYPEAFNGTRARQNKQNDMCAQQRLRSTWASEPSLMCALWVSKDLTFLHADSEVSDQTVRMPRLVWVFAGCTSFCWFCRAPAQLYTSYRSHWFRLVITTTTDNPTPSYPWATTWQNKQNDCAPSEDSDQPGPTPSLSKSLRLRSLGS